MAMASKIKLSYHNRLFLLLVVFTWGIILCTALFQYSREKEYKSELLSAKLELYNFHLLEIIDNGLPFEEYITPDSYPFADMRVTIITLAGAVVYDNIYPIDLLDNHLSRPEIAAALRNGSGHHIGRHSISDGRQYFYSASKGKRAIVRTAIPYSVSLRELLRPDWAFLWVMIAICITITIVAYIVTRRLGKNIVRLNDFAHKAQNGETLDNYDPFPGDELGSIANHIVRLYRQWQQTIADRDQAHQAAMHEEQEKIRIKKELTNNINHELKTPVASMKVCLETLLSGIQLTDEKRQDLIERSYSHNLRLCNLLNDVSLITRMEDGGQHIAREEVCVNDIIHELSDEMSILPDDERITLNVDFADNVNIHGNRSLISSIFRNLTENAMAYSGGNNIYITLLENNATTCHIRFEDDGCGVETDKLPHLFDRFYRIDRGRSRQMGGTGLGLSIVKHAVLFHGGTITATNRTGGGLRFDFYLKKE